MLIIPAVLLAGALLLAMVLNIVLKPAFAARLTTVCLIVSVLGGVIFYGAGYMERTGNLLLTVIRTPVFVLRMFVGVNELSAIEGSTLVSSPAGMFFFWLFHLFAFYSIASAAMITIGAEALRHLRILLSRRGDLVLIYGINENSIALGKECLDGKSSSVVFIAEEVSDTVLRDLNYSGMSVVAGPSAVNSDKRTMRRLRVGKRKLMVYALDAQEDRNLYYALRLKDALEKEGVPAENTSLALPGAEDILTPMLQVSSEAYGFGYVHVFDPSMLVARALIRMCPPWESVRFSEDGRAAENYECAIVGFGSHGQAALRQLIMNGQFEGSSFRAAVFSLHFEAEAGYLTEDCPELLKRYEIHQIRADGRSAEFYRYVEERSKTLKLIAVCTGDEEMNREISDNLMLFLQRRTAENICVVRCGKQGVRYQERVGSPIISYSIYSREFLSAKEADRGAVLLNAVYDSSDRSDWEKWIACDSFSKMSSRASADFLPAFVRASGSSREEILAGSWDPSPALLETLGRTEHLRWNAFHFAMGYRPMSREEFEANAETWLQCRQKGVPCPIRITKNSEARTHACLIPWEELDELSEREKAVTGREVDYKQTDINNVLALPMLLKATDGGERI